MNILEYRSVFILCDSISSICRLHFFGVCLVIRTCVCICVFSGRCCFVCLFEITSGLSSVCLACLVDCPVLFCVGWLRRRLYFFLFGNSSMCLLVCPSGCRWVCSYVVRRVWMFDYLPRLIDHLFVCVAICLFVCRCSICSSVCLICVCFPARLFALGPSICLFVCFSVCCLVWLYVCLFVCMPIRLSACLSMFPYVCVSGCPSIWMFVCLVVPLLVCYWCICLIGCAFVVMSLSLSLSLCLSFSCSMSPSLFLTQFAHLWFCVFLLLPFFLSICLAVGLFGCWFGWFVWRPSVCLFVGVFVGCVCWFVSDRLSIVLSICLFVWFVVCRSICMFVCLSVEYALVFVYICFCMFASLFVCLCLCVVLSVFLPVCLSVCASVWLFAYLMFSRLLSLYSLSFSFFPSLSVSSPFSFFSSVSPDMRVGCRRMIVHLARYLLTWLLSWCLAYTAFWLFSLYVPICAHVFSGGGMIYIYIYIYIYVCMWYAYTKHATVTPIRYERLLYASLRSLWMSYR